MHSVLVITSVIVRLWLIENDLMVVVAGCLPVSTERYEENESSRTATISFAVDQISTTDDVETDSSLEQLVLGAM